MSVNTERENGKKKEIECFVFQILHLTKTPSFENFELARGRKCSGEQYR